MQFEQLVAGAVIAFCFSILVRMFGHYGQKSEF
jgi:hypothetical protein